MDNLWITCEIRKKKLIFHALYIKRKNKRKNNNNNNSLPRSAWLRLGPYPNGFKKLWYALILNL